MTSLKDSLTQILIKNKLISQENLDKAIQLQKEKGGRLSELLVNLGLIQEKDLVIALSQGLGIPPIDLSKLKIDTDVTKLISKETAKHYLILPISKVGNTLTVAMADPLNIFTIDDLKILTGLKINPVITTAKDIMSSIESSYAAQSVVEDKGKIEEILHDISQPDIELVKIDTQEKAVDEESLMHLIEDAPVVKIANKLLIEGVKLKASDILLEPLESKMRVRYRVDGILRSVEEIPKYMHDSIVSRIKVMSSLNISEHRLPQDGRFKIISGEREVDFRVSILPSVFGEKAALRILDKSTAMLDIDALGFDAGAVSKIKHSASSPHGMILICGPTGSGKTTTLYSILKFVDSPEENIVTVEDPVEFQLEGINQVTANPEIGLSFAAALRSILRQDPDIIMVGEIRDFDTLDIAIKSALTGHLLLSTLHTTTAAGTIIRLINMGSEPFLINSCLLAIISQRLIRKLCPKCRKIYTISDTLKKSIAMYLTKADSMNFHQPVGCKDCFNIGYRGRVGIAEVLVMSPKIRELVLARAQEVQIKEIAIKEGMQTLRADGVRKALNAETTLEEVVKVTMSD